MKHSHKYSYLLSVIIISFIFNACSTTPSLPLTISIADRIKNTTSAYDRTIWLKQVTFVRKTLKPKEYATPLADAMLEDEYRFTEEAVTVNIAEFMRGKRYYNKVCLYPGEMNAGDLVFDITIVENKWEVRSEYACYPLSLITLSAYYWFGGISGYEYIDYRYVLKVSGRDGKELYSKELTDQNRYKQNFYSSYHCAEAREVLLDKLVSDFNKSYFKQAR